MFQISIINNMAKRLGSVAFGDKDKENKYRARRRVAPMRDLIFSSFYWSMENAGLSSRVDWDHLRAFLGVTPFFHVKERYEKGFEDRKKLVLFLSFVRNLEQAK